MADDLIKINDYFDDYDIEVSSPGINRQLFSITDFILYKGLDRTTPLGKAEWIKFFAAFYNKEALANKLFSEIKTAYLNAKKLALKAKNNPYRFKWSHV